MRAIATKIALIASIVIASSAALATPTMQEVEGAIRAGNFQGAETLLSEVTRDKPGSAKAWYFLAQTEAKLGKMPEASADLQEASRLDPGLSFASPGAVESLRHSLSAPQPRAQQRQITRTTTVERHQSAPVAHESSGGAIALGVLAVIAFLGFLFLYVIYRVIRWMFGWGPSAQTYHGGGPGGTVVVNNGSSGPGLLGSLLIAEAITDHGHGRDRDDRYSESSQSWDDSGSQGSQNSGSSFDMGGSSSDSWDSGSSSSDSSSDW